jgi:DNA polymerase/3'-5' exonuclease PolX
MNTSTQKNKNRYIAKVLAEVADLLQQQNASSFRVSAYRKAADYIASAAPPLRQVNDASGLAGLEALPTIGTTIAKAVAEFLDTGSLAMLARLRGSLDPEKLFQSVP